MSGGGGGGGWQVATKFSVKHQGKDIHHPTSTIHKLPVSNLPRSTLCPSLYLSFIIKLLMTLEACNKLALLWVEAKLCGLMSIVHVKKWWMAIGYPQVAKNVNIVETLGSLKLLGKISPAAGLWLVKLLILANHRPAAGEFFPNSLSYPSASNIFTLLATCGVVAFLNM